MTPSSTLVGRRACLAMAGAAWLLPAEVRAGESPLRRATEPLFGSPIELLAPDGPAAAAAFAEVLRGLRAMNQRWNAWKPGELGALNRALREGRAAPVSPELRALIAGARRLEQLSGGLFNPAIGGLVGAWGFHDDELRPGPLPTAAALAPWRRAAPSLSQLRLDGVSASSDNRRLQLDFGAYAKGVAADWALQRLRARGVRDAVVNLGGNLAAMGGLAGRPWRVGIRDPAGPGALATVHTAGHEAVVTSGGYERFRLLDGRPYAHVIDPLFGAPAAELVSVTVVHPSTALADAAATALLVAGPRHWPAAASRMGVDQVLAIDRHLHGQATPALAARLHGLSPAWRTRLSVS